MSTEDDIKSLLDSLNNLDGIYKKLAKQQISDIQIKSKLKDFDEKELKNDIEKTKQFINASKNLADFNDMVKKTTKTWGEASGEFVSDIAKAGAGAVNSMLGSSDALQTSGALLNDGIDTVNKGFQAASGGIASMGTRLSESSGKLRHFGGVVTLGADALSIFSSAASALAKAGFGMMLRETQKLITDFHQLSTIGAVYSQGLTTITGLTVKAGMTTDQFTKAVMSNKDNFTAAGIGIVEGSRRMAGAMHAGGQVARDSMFNLGMTMDDQADAYATTMARMAGPFGKLLASDGEIASATKDYAENLKVISDITGKTAAEQQQAAKARSATLNMQIEIAKMAPAARVKFQAALGAMDPAAAKAMQDRMAFNGQVVDKNTALMESMSPALKAYHQAEYNLAKQGKLTGEEDMRLHAKYASAMQEQLLSQKALAAAGSVAGSSVEGLTNAMGEAIQSNANYVGVNVDAMIAAKKSAETDSKGVVAGQLMADVQKQQMTIQGLVNQHLQDFAGILDSTTKGLTAMLNAIGHPESTWDKIKSTMSTLFPTMGMMLVTGMMQGVGKGGMLKSVLGDVASVGGKSLLAMAGEAIAGVSAATLGIAGAAATGVAASGQMIFGKEGLIHGGSGANFLSNTFEDLTGMNDNYGPSDKTKTTQNTSLPVTTSTVQTSKNEHLSKIDKTNDHLDTQQSLLRKILDINERQLSILQKTYNATV